MIVPRTARVYDRSCYSTIIADLFGNASFLIRRCHIKIERYLLGCGAYFDCLTVVAQRQWLRGL